MKDGFSKLTKSEKIDWVIENFFNSSNDDIEILKQYWSEDEELQKIHDEFSENTLTNFFIPLGIAPNFLIDNKNYTIPMAIEESSVVAAACKSAKFWSKRGGFKTEIINVIDSLHKSEEFTTCFQGKVFDKGAQVVATPDGVWHKDSHYRRKFIGGVHMLMISIME